MNNAPSLSSLGISTQDADDLIGWALRRDGAEKIIDWLDKKRDGGVCFDHFYRRLRRLANDTLSRAAADDANEP